MVVEVGWPQEGGHREPEGGGGEDVQCGRCLVGEADAQHQQPGDDHDDGGADRHQGRCGQLRCVGEAEHVLQPEGERHPDEVGPDQLGDDHAAVEGPRGEECERQHGQQESGRDPGGEPGRLARPPGGEREYHQHRQDGPHLDRAREPEREAAPDQAPPAGQPVAVEHRERPQQAEQHQPRLEQHGSGRLQAVRVHGDDPAAKDHREQPAVTGEQARQRHGGGTGQHGEHPPGGHPGEGAGRLGRQRDRGHQQRDPGRLHHDEVAVRQRPVDQPDGAAEVGPVVVFGDPEQVAGAAQLIQPERQGNQGRHDDHRGRRPGQDEPATGAPARDGRREPGAGRCRRRSAHGCVTPHVVRRTRYTRRPWPLPGPGRRFPQRAGIWPPRAILLALRRHPAGCHLP